MRFFALFVSVLWLQIDARAETQGQANAAGTTQVVDPFEEPETRAMQEESQEEDITYLTSRLVYRYDYKSQQRDSFFNRFRLRGIFAFGDFGASTTLRRFDVSVTIPVVRRDTPVKSVSGLSDVEAQFGAVIHKRERFRDSASIEFALHFSTDDLLSAGTPTVKPAWGFTALITPRTELNSVFNYKRSIGTPHGAPRNEFEPDLTLNTHWFGATWRLEWDSFYLITPGRLAQTAKTGVSRRFGERYSWVVAPYYSIPLNNAGRQTQYIHNIGMDVSLSFAAKR